MRQVCRRKFVRGFFRKQTERGKCQWGYTYRWRFFRDFYEKIQPLAT